ncbi:MAG: neutral zinc metallopeptidase [Casimicrobiaceae bacterium]
MRWGDMRPSDNVEQGGSGGGGFPLGGGMRLGGGAVILIVIVSLIFGINPLSMLGMMEGGGPVVTEPSQTAPSQTNEQRAAKDPAFDFARRVVGDTEDVWTALFKQMGSRYEPPTLREFRGSTRSGCGGATSASGPFYCPADRKVYLDLAFFEELSSRKFGAPGDFAAAYVIAHEVGHHVQNLLGTMDKFQATAQRGDPRARNEASVRLELQADCYAGVWGFYAAKRNLLEAGDVEEGLRAASAVGDDNITKGRVSPDAFTHGTAAQRVHWFRQGMSTGDPRTCNTFARGP